MASSENIRVLDSLLRSRVSNATLAGAEATTLMLVEFRTLAQTPEASAAVQEAEAAWVVFNQAFASAARAVGSSQGIARDS